MNFVKSPPGLPVTAPHNYCAAAYNAMDEIRIIYEESFIPCLNEQILKPTPYERLLQTHATRALGLLRALDKLDAQAHFQSVISLVRTLFEMSVDIEMICNGARLPPPADKEEVVLRHALMCDCQKLKRFKIIKDNPQTSQIDLGKLAEAWVKNNEVGLDARAWEVLGHKKADSVKHWHTPQLSRRVVLLDSILAEPIFEQWYKLEYSLASTYVHGTLGHGTGDASADQLFSVCAMIMAWCAEFLPVHFMHPIFKGLQLDKANPDSWGRIEKASGHAFDRMQRFIVESPAIWQKAKEESMSPSEMPRRA